MLAMDEHVQAMSIEEMRVVAKSIEMLEDIPLDENDPKNYTRVRVSMEEKTK